MNPQLLEVRTLGIAGERGGGAVSELSTRTRQALTANIAQVNSVVGHWHALGAIHTDFVLGALASVSAAQSSRFVMQAGLCTERGLVAIHWRHDDLAFVPDVEPMGVLWEARRRAVSVLDCHDHERWTVSRQAQFLLCRLFEPTELFPELT